MSEIGASWSGWCERKLTRWAGTTLGGYLKRTTSIWLSTNFVVLHFLCPISDQLISPFFSWRLVVNKWGIVKSVTAKSCTQISCTRAYWNKLFARSICLPSEKVILVQYSDKSMNSIVKFLIVLLHSLLLCFCTVLLCEVITIQCHA